MKRDEWRLRWEILAALAGPPCTTAEVAKMVGRSNPVTDRSLMTMLEPGYVRVWREMTPNKWTLTMKGKRLSESGPIALGRALPMTFTDAQVLWASRSPDEWSTAWIAWSAKLPYKTVAASLRRLEQWGLLRSEARIGPHGKFRVWSAA